MRMHTQFGSRLLVIPIEGGVHTGIVPEKKFGGKGGERC